MLATSKVDNDAFFVVKYILESLGIQRAFDSSYLWFHPHYPSMLAIKDSLAYEGVKITAVKLEIDQLSSQITPLIISLSSDNGRDEFVILEKIDTETVTIVGYYHGKTLIQKTQLNKCWDGSALIVEQDNDSMSTSLNMQDLEIFNVHRLIGMIWLTAGIALAFTLAMQFSKLNIALLISNLVGLALTGVLIMREFYNKNFKLIERFCMNGNLDCHAVAQARVATIGSVRLSEMSLIYFAGSLVVMGFVTQAGPVQFIVSLLTVPIILFTLYQQLVVIRKICLLCLLIQVILLCQLALYSVHVNFISWDMLSVLPFYTLAYLVPALLWFQTRMTRPYSILVREGKARSALFKSTISYFDFFLSSERESIEPVASFDLIMGNEDARFRITAVLSFDCDYCRTVYEELMVIRKIFGDSISIRIMFSPKGRTLEQSPEVVQILASVHVEHILMQWMRRESSDLKSNDNVAHQVGLPEMKKRFEERNEWLHRNQIIKTPMVYINEKVLEEGLSILDFSFYFRINLS